jgi:CRP-like cAMP-binding protein
MATTLRREQEKCVRVLISKGRFGLRHYRAGATIVAQGDDETRAFVVRDGWGCISRNLRGGERQLIEFPVAGDILDCSVTAVGHQEEFSALTDMTLWEGLSTRLRTLGESEIAVASFVTQANRRRHGTLVERLTDLAKRDAGMRIAHFLLELGARLALNGVASCKGYNCPLTQQDLADALGLTPIHANRMLRDARTLGLYEFRRGRVEFLDYAATVEFADFDTDFLAVPDTSSFLTHDSPAERTIEP